MADIDDFKRCNDTRGHSAGDRLLADISAVLLHEVREADLVARYGGEEFFILMPGATTNKAEEIAERVRTGVAAKTGSTMSLGVATHREGMRKEELIKSADEALYRAKQKGKNRIETAV